MSILLTIVGLSILIILHELGHYLAARVMGMRVLRFSLGFGPPLVQRQIGETTWQIAAVFLGGYVQIHGMGPADPTAPKEDPRSFKNRPLWQRGLVVFAGPVANWLLAAFLVSVLSLTVGFRLPDQSSTVLGEIMAGSPAAKAGLQSGDRVLAVAGEQVSDWTSLVAAIQKFPDQEITFEVERDHARRHFRVTPRRTAQGYGQIGVRSHVTVLRFGLLGSIAAGLKGAWSLTQQQVSDLWDMAVGNRSGKLAGVFEIVDTVADQAKAGLEFLIAALAHLSITLFLLNLLPIPALDGSRLLFLTVEAVRRRPVDQRIEAVVHGVGFFILLALILFVSVKWFFVR